ncbi:MAG: hypothetical protein V7642_3129 [Burkholderiales bacterium]|jgi:hypothetical protein
MASKGGLEMQELNTHPAKDVECQDTYAACYVGRIPTRVKRELERLPEYVFLYLKGLDNIVSTYVVWQGNRPLIVFLFEIKNRRVNVFNHINDVDETEIHRFADHIFSKFEPINIIHFKAVHSNIRRSSFPFPLQKHNATENFVITLPQTLAEYERNLGKSTRKTIRYYSNKLARHFPSFSHQVYTKGDIREEHVRAILSLREARFTAKKRYRHDGEESIERVINLAKRSGLVTVIVIDDRVCAGTINFRSGSNFIGYVLAHDSAYNDFRIGTLCAYMAISAAIARGGAKFELGSGRYEYKSSLLGVRLDMDRLEIYRSPQQLALNLDNVVKAVVLACIRRLKLWLLRHEKSLISRSVFEVSFFLRNLRTNKCDLADVKPPLSNR